MFPWVFNLRPKGETGKDLVFGTNVLLRLNSISTPSPNSVGKAEDLRTSNVEVVGSSSVLARYNLCDKKAICPLETEVGSLFTANNMDNLNTWP